MIPTPTSVSKSTRPLKRYSISTAASLDDLVEFPGRSADYNVRWVVVHMLEETARHAGHADIIRELYDGTTEIGYTS
jgi:hypothetical protein